MTGNKVYEAPVLTKIGTFEQITQGSEDGSHTDAIFDVNTPKEDLTFSDMG